MQNKAQDESVMSSPASEPLRDDLSRAVQTIGTKFGWEVRGAPMIPSILKVLGSYACERRVSYELRNREDRVEKKKFDPLFLEKHSFAVRFVLARIVTRLEEEGLKTAISGEARVAHGIYDVLIEAATPLCTIYLGNVPKIKLEFKGSNGIELEQVQRYIMGDPSPLLVVRVTMGQTAMLRPKQLTEFVEASIRETTNKARRALAALPEEAIKVPGRDCWGCPDGQCPYVRRRSQEGGLVKLSSEDFADDLNRLFRELPRVADAVADTVVAELLGHMNAPAE